METFDFGDAGVSRQNFTLDVNAKDYGFEPTDSPRTDRSVEFPRPLVNHFSPVCLAFKSLTALSNF